jgi:dTMP kinase
MDKKISLAIEGSDGAGKETQSKLLKKSLEEKGLKVASVSFPRYRETTGGWILWEALKGDDAAKYQFAKLDPYAASLPYTMDRRESKGYLERLIADNDVVIFDRYVESNLLHQGGKISTAEERVRYGQWLYELEYGTMALPRPDFVLYLMIPFWLSRARAQRRADGGGPKLDAVESDLDYVKKGHEGGVFYAEQFGWEVVEGLEHEHELTPEEVHQKVIQRITPRFHDKGIKV